jgi:hypothetical protein
VAEPTAPHIPDDAPQDVKDFFECRGSTLNWQSGDVTWLGLKVTPSVAFAAGANRGEVNITVGILGGMVSFTLPASVNAAGELVVDTSSVPDLSEWGLGGRADIDAAIKRINDWFKHNGKKLKPARLAGGTVVLEKVPIAAAPAAKTGVVPTPVPVQPTPPKPVPAPVTPPPAQSSSGSGCGLLGFLMIALLLGVIALGAGVGYMFLGGPGPAAQATATPSAAPTTNPTPSATATATASPSAVASVTPAPTPTPSAAPTASPGSAIAGACVRVVHQAVGDFISYLDWYVYLLEEDIDYLEVVVQGANNDEPATLEFDSPTGAYYGILGLHSAGAKEIIRATLVLVDGTRIDVTDDLADALGGKRFVVRFPQEDSFGNCLEQ